MPDKIYKVFHSLEKDGKVTINISDLQYDEGIPYVVLEWLNTYEGEIPSIRVPLDPKYLHVSKSRKYNYSYGYTVVWPKHR
jgi:hypothetical protein